MSEHSSIRLGDALEAEGYGELARRARLHEFHDFRSPHALPQHVLVAELGERAGAGAERLKLRVMEGEFDASKAESDEWTASPEGKAAMAALGVAHFVPESGVADENHALLIGHVLGAMMRLSETGTPTEAEPEVDGAGNYTNRVKVKRTSGEYFVIVEKIA